jgi:non-homologous end joining protein Ku
VAFAGQTIPVAAFKRVNRQRPPSFKMLAPSDSKPVKQVLQDSSGDIVNRADTGRGVEIGKAVHPLPAAALELIEKVGRSQVVEIERFTALSSVEPYFDLTLDTYAICPDEKSPGSESSVQTLWNGLRHTERAAVIPNWSPRAGSRPSILVVHAADEGLVGNVLPFSYEIKHNDEAFQPTVDEKQGKMFEAALDIFEPVLEDFDLEAYKDTWLARRQAAIDMALAGEAIPVDPELEAPTGPVPDLLSALEAAVAKKGAAKKSAAKPAKKAAVKS